VIVEEFRCQQLGGVLDAAPWRGEDRVTGDRDLPAGDRGGIPGL
jgi:hypothetical protein